MLHSNLPPNLTTKPNKLPNGLERPNNIFLFSCGKRILHQRADGHRTHSARYWSNERTLFSHFIELHVTI